MKQSRLIVLYCCGGGRCGMHDSYWGCCVWSCRLPVLAWLWRLMKVRCAKTHGGAIESMLFVNGDLVEEGKD